jgi:hypothetical protein
MIFAKICFWAFSVIFCVCAATAMTSLTTGNWSWIELVNRGSPSIFHLSKPGNEAFCTEIGKRPWSDPMPVLAFFTLTSVVIVFLSYQVITTARLFDAFDLFQI